ncbi:MAG: hypothetical protein ACE5GB_13305, partial [Acidimicrobiales bacterium]
LEAIATVGPERPIIDAIPVVDRSRHTVGRLPAAVGALAATAMSAANLARWPWSALAIGALVYLALRSDRLTSSLPLLSALSLGVAALYVMYRQRTDRPPPDFAWPRQFEDVHVLGVLAVLLMLAEYLRVIVVARVRSAEGSSPG